VTMFENPPTGPMSPEAIGDAFLQCVGYPPRTADLQVLEMLGKDPETVADYIWDHHMGEPEGLAEIVLRTCQVAAFTHGDR